MGPGDGQGGPGFKRGRAVAGGSPFSLPLVPIATRGGSCIRELLEVGLTTDVIREVLPRFESAEGDAHARECPDAKDLDGLRRQLTSLVAE